VLMPARMDTLACGVLAWLVRQPDSPGWPSARTTWGWWLAGACAVRPADRLLLFPHQAVGLYAGYLLALIYALVLFTWLRCARPRWCGCFPPPCPSASAGTRTSCISGTC
jgi:hypothetical protein